MKIRIPPHLNPEIELPYSSREWKATCNWLSTCTAHEFADWIGFIRSLNPGKNINLVLIHNIWFKKAYNANTAYQTYIEKGWFV